MRSSRAERDTELRTVEGLLPALVLEPVAHARRAASNSRPTGFRQAADAVVLVRQSMPAERVDDHQKPEKCGRRARFAASLLEDVLEPPEAAVAHRPRARSTLTRGGRQGRRGRRGSARESLTAASRQGRLDGVMAEAKVSSFSIIYNDLAPQLRRKHGTSAAFAGGPHGSGGPADSIPAEAVRERRDRPHERAGAHQPREHVAEDFLTGSKCRGVAKYRPPDRSSDHPIDDPSPTLRALGLERIDHGYERPRHVHDVHWLRDGQRTRMPFSLAPRDTFG
jgi:hypothetical protein